MRTHLGRSAILSCACRSRFEQRFERFRERLSRIARVLHRNTAHLFAHRLSWRRACCRLLLLPWLGQDFFPASTAAQFKLHLRARTGTRIEETAAPLRSGGECHPRRQIPPREIASIIDNIGLPYSSINLSYSNSAPIGTGDADIMVELTRRSSSDRRIRPRIALRSWPRNFPASRFTFLPADMVSQILNFGLPAPIDIQVVGRESGRPIARSPATC